MEGDLKFGVLKDHQVCCFRKLLVELAEAEQSDSVVVDSKLLLQE